MNKGTQGRRISERIRGRSYEILLYIIYARNKTAMQGFTSEDFLLAGAISLHSLSWRQITEDCTLLWGTAAPVVKSHPISDPTWMHAIIAVVLPTLFSNRWSNQTKRNANSVFRLEQVLRNDWKGNESD